MYIVDERTENTVVFKELRGGECFIPCDFDDEPVFIKVGFNETDNSIDESKGWIGVDLSDGALYSFNGNDKVIKVNTKLILRN